MCFSVYVRQDFENLEIEYDADTNFGKWNRLIVTQAKLPDEDSRIFANYYAPVITYIDNKKVIEPMRYSCYSPSYMTEAQVKKLSTFNARRDSLQKRFWSEAFGVNHGIIVLKGFYEWVAVKDLVKTGVVTIDQIRAKFEQESEERKQKILSQGKKYAPTKTELKDPIFRNIIIEFRPDISEDLVVPVIYNTNKEGTDYGFAIITDEPTPEIQAAGHDRMPINLSRNAIEDWLHPQGKSFEQIDLLFDVKEKEKFSYKIA